MYIQIEGVRANGMSVDVLASDGISGDDSYLVEEIQYESYIEDGRTVKRITIELRENLYGENLEAFDDSGVCDDCSASGITGAPEQGTPFL